MVKQLYLKLIEGIKQKNAKVQHSDMTISKWSTPTTKYLTQGNS